MNKLEPCLPLTVPHLSYFPIVFVLLGLVDVDSFLAEGPISLTCCFDHLTLLSLKLLLSVVWGCGLLSATAL